MRIAESKLRSFIKRVLIESSGLDIYTSIETLTSPENISKYTDQNFEDFLSSKPLTMSEEDKDKYFKLCVSLLVTFMLNNDKENNFKNAKLLKHHINNKGSLKVELEEVYSFIEDYDDQWWILSYYNETSKSILGHESFSSMKELSDFVKSIGDSKESFVVNASRFLEDIGCVDDDDIHNLHLMKRSISIIKKGFDFFGAVKELNLIRAIIVRSLDLGDMIDMYVRYMEEFDIDIGESQIDLIKETIKPERIDGITLRSTDIYRSLKPLKLMKIIYEYLSKLEYLNNISGRF